MNARMLIVGTVVAVFAVSIFALAGEKDDADSSADLPDYSDKVLLVYTNGNPGYPNYIMVESRVRRIGNRLFLSGKYADTRRKEDWRSGMETHIAWDAVVAYHVMTAKQYEEFLDGAEEKNRN